MRSRFCRRFIKRSMPHTVSRTFCRLHADGPHTRKEERSSLHRVMDGLVTDHGWFALQQRGPQDLVLCKWDLGILDVCPKKAPTHLLCCFHVVFTTTRTSIDGVWLSPRSFGLLSTGRPSKTLLPIFLWKPLGCGQVQKK